MSREIPSGSRTDNRGSVVGTWFDARTVRREYRAAGILLEEMKGKTEPRYGSVERDVIVHPVVEFVGRRKYEQEERGDVPER
jgi:hypothetical protein